MKTPDDMGFALPAGDVAALEAAQAALAAIAGDLAAFHPPAVDRTVPVPAVVPLTGNAPMAEQFARIERDGPRLNCFTRLLKDRALAPPVAGPLAGASFAVKDLIDVAGLSTTAGAAVRAHAPPAKRDAEVVARLVKAAPCWPPPAPWTQFAYGFVTVNAHDGTTRNPHDVTRVAGGSSGGSAAAVAARLVRFSLGSDTNGSIRVPAALCGIYGLRPTHGLVPLEGVFPFVESLDVVGPFATSMADLKSVHEVCAGAALASVAIGGLRIARLDGWFRKNVDPELTAGIDAIAAHLGAPDFASWPEPALARGCAFVLTAAEGGARQVEQLRRDAAALDPATRARFAAGASLGAGAVVAAQNFRGWFDGAMQALWQTVDVLIAPSAPCVAPRIDDCHIDFEGGRVPARSHLGIFTQPVNLAGCPVLAAPLKRPGKLPLGIQLIAAPGREDILFAVAAKLEADGLIGSDPPVP